jgi:DNA polymerase I-like protein with 3'-5' exonuclease and polymerase domains
LYRYGGHDVKTDYIVRDWAVGKAVNRGQVHLAKKKYVLQNYCRTMHRNGLFVNVTKVHQFIKEQEQVKRDAHRLFVDTLKITDKEFNLNSSQQLGKLLYETLDLEPTVFTATGQPACNNSAINALICDKRTPPHVVTALEDGFKKFKTALTVINMFLKKWLPGAGFVLPGEFEGKQVWRIYPQYSATGTVGWRYSSQNPNFQNVPEWLRDCFEEPEGYVLAGADFDQLELRMGALLAECTPYLDVIRAKNIDAHNFSGIKIFGDAYWNKDGAPKDPRKKGEGDFALRRTLIKRIVFLKLYGGRPRKMWSVIREDEDKQGRLIFKDLTLEEVTAISRGWDRAFPEFERWGRTIQDEFNRQNYLEEPVWGLRRYFDNGGNYNELLNFKVQAGGAALVHQGTAAVLPDLPDVVTQVHDYVGWRVREDELDRAKSIIMERLPQRWGGLDFTVEFKKGKTLRGEK